MKHIFILTAILLMFSCKKDESVPPTQSPADIHSFIQGSWYWCAYPTSTTFTFNGDTMIKTYQGSSNKYFYSVNNNQGTSYLSYYKLVQDTAHIPSSGLVIDSSQWSQMGVDIVDNQLFLVDEKCCKR